VNKAALITGSAKRIGKEVAIALAKDGIDIAIHYNKSKDQAYKLQSQIRELGVRCEVFEGDLSHNCYKVLIQKILKEFPNLDILINNASIFEKTPLLKTNLDQFDRHFNINFKAPFFLTQYFATLVKKGVVINFLDGRVNKTSKEYFSYLLTKKILHDFTKMSAIELGPDIRVNGVAPGITEFSLDIDDQSYFKKIVNMLPLRRIAKRDEITNAVKVLIQNDALTGQVLFVDGGENL
jgi:NAD(P)-dependent dehydrogenase (short-subunit alcohol dehydrogenase family)